MASWQHGPHYQYSLFLAILAPLIALLEVTMAEAPAVSECRQFQFLARPGSPPDSYAWMSTPLARQRAQVWNGGSDARLRSVLSRYMRSGGENLTVAFLGGSITAGRRGMGTCGRRRGPGACVAVLRLITGTVYRYKLYRYINFSISEHVYHILAWDSEILLTA